VSGSFETAERKVNTSIKGIFTQKNENSVIHLHVVSKLFDFLSSVKSRRMHFSITLKQKMTKSIIKVVIMSDVLL